MIKKRLMQLVRFFVICIWLSLISVCYSQSGSSPAGHCVHPVNFRQIDATVVYQGVLKFSYRWDSSSGNLGDLNRVWVGEHVTCPNNGRLPRPPWKGNFLTPGITPSRMTNNGPDGGFNDHHFPPGSMPNLQPPVLMWPDAGPEHSFTSTQNYGYHCRVCDGRPPDSSLGWQINIFPTISITRWVEITGLGWRYRITKSGLTTTRQLQ